MSGLRIEYVHAALEIDTTPARFAIKHSRPQFETSNVGVPKPSFEPTDYTEVNSQQDIWSKVWDESSHRTPRMQQQFFDKSSVAVSTPNEIIVDTAQSTAKTKTRAAQSKMSSPAPQVAQQSKRRSSANLDMGNIKINWDDHLLEINWEGLERPQFTWEPGSIEIHLKEQPAITITFDPPEAGKFFEPELIEF